MPSPKCDACGRFFSMLDSSAHIEMVTPDSAYTSETYESLCGACARQEAVEVAIARERERCAKICEEARDRAVRRLTKEGPVGPEDEIYFKAQQYQADLLAQEIRQG